jgi:hypothetical protein
MDAAEARSARFRARMLALNLTIASDHSPTIPTHKTSTPPTRAGIAHRAPKLQPTTDRQP